MNKVHSIVWSKARNSWVVVAEGTKAVSKAGGAGLKVLIALIMLSPVAGNAATLPSGGSISIGQGTIVTSGANELVIRQNTDKLGINWQSFNVGADGRVIFEQPNANSVALNRVVGSDGSAILGKIDANGQVFLVNPNGVMFGKNAQVNVGGLVASTLDITDKNFEEGNYTFERNGANGAVVNQGTLKATSGGYVALIGKSVKNQGLIQATLGTAAMAAGDSVTLDMSGDGLINLQVKKAAVGALLDNQGVIIADGGQALMTARAANALTETVINNSGIIQAQTISNKAGKIILDGGPVDGQGTVVVAGTLDASAPTTGNGGFIETSGANVKIDKAVKISTKAKNGKTGTWLIDPEDFNIDAGDGAQTVNSIGSNTLSNLLGSTNVEIQTVDYTGGVDSGGGESGGSGSTGGADINVNGAVSWGSDTTLTLSAAGDINVNNDITVNGQNAGLEMNFGGSVNVESGSSVTFNGANNTYAENGKNFQLLRTLDDLKKLNGVINTEYFALANDIDAADTINWNGGLGFESDGYMVASTLNGLGHSITDLYINRTTDEQARLGLLGEVKNSTIANLRVTGTLFGYANSGMLAGVVTESKVHNIEVEGFVSGQQWLGGVIGYASNNYLLRDIVSKATVDGTVVLNGDPWGGSNTGGIIGSSVDNKNISRLTYNGAMVSGIGRVGGIIGTSNRDVIDGLVIGSGVLSPTIVGNSYVGGAIGFVSNGKISNVKVLQGDIEGAYASGGAFGSLYKSSVDHIQSNGFVSGLQQLGGLSGEAISSTIEDVYATGTVHGGQEPDEWGDTAIDVGGLIGYASESNISNAISLGDVDGYHSVGGLIGTSELSNVENAFSMSKVTAVDTVGGFVGSVMGGSLTNAYATGQVRVIDPGDSGNTDVKAGGFVGQSDSATYTHTYSTGRVISMPGGTSGGFAGQSAGDVYDGAFWATDSSHQSTSAGGAVGKTTAELKTASTYDSWNLDTTGTLSSADWRIYDGYSLPMLKFLMGDIEFEESSIELTFDGQGHTYDPSDLYALKSVTDKEFYAALMDFDSLGVAGGGFNNVRNAGTYTSVLYGGQFGYNIINNVSTLTINKANLVIGALANDKVYDGSTSITLNWFGLLSDGGLYSADAQFHYTSASFTDKNAGDIKGFEISGIYLTGADAANFNFNTSASGTAKISKAVLDVGAVGNWKYYDSTTNANVTFTDNRQGLDSISITGSANYDDKNAGYGKTVSVTDIQVSGVDAGNYTWNSTAQTTSHIEKYGITAVATGHDKVYDGNVRTSVDLDYDVFAGDDVTVTGTAFFNDKNAGSNKSFFVGWVGLTGADSQNYYLTDTYGTANITKASLGISAEANSKVYDGNTSVSIGLNDDRVSGDDLVIGYAGADFEDKNAGQGKAINVNGLSVSGADAQNYTWATSITTSADIEKATLVLGASGVNKTYNGNTDADVNFNDNRILGDDLSISATASFDNKNAGVGKVITLDDIVITGADAQNYDVLAPASVTADIGKATLTISASGVDKTYNGSVDADLTLSDNRIAGDDLTFDYNATFADKNAGTGKVVSVDSFGVSGDDAQNYDVLAPITTTATINKADLHISASGVDKVYDGSTTALIGLNDDRILGDDLSLSFADARFSDKNAGSDKHISVNGLTVTGADADNYNFNTSTTTTADISKAQLTVGVTGVDKVYNGSTGANLVVNDNRIAGDDLSIDYAASFGDKNAGSNKVVTASGITVSGTDAGNYTWNTTAVTTANITKATLTVSGTVQDKVYDGSTQGSVGVLTDNRIAGDDLVISAAGATFADKNAGSKAAEIHEINVQGADAGNYEWNSVSTTVAEITKAFLNILVTGSNKSYDGTVDASVTLSDDRVTGDSIHLSFDSANFADKNAGASKSISVSGVTLAGDDAGNYTVSTSLIGHADIAKANLTVSANQQSKKQGEADPNLDWKITGGSLFGDDAITGSLARAPGESVGSYALNQGSLTAGGNYNLSFEPGMLSIEVSKPSAVSDVVASITSTKMQLAKLEGGNNSTDTDYRLLNLGMKLPSEEVWAPMDPLLTEEQEQ